MTIDEAIAHAREVASQGCTECNRDHEQLADWLEELKVYKKALKLACEAIEDNGCSDSICGSNCELYSPCSNEITWEEYFLKKARQE